MVRGICGRGDRSLSTRVTDVGRGWTIIESHGPHLFVPIAPGPEGVRAAACPVCHDTVAVPGRTRWLQVRCRACGTEFVATDGSPAPPPPPAPEKPRARERVYLREAGVLVTDARFVAAGRTVDLDPVTSCRTDVEPGGWRWPGESLWAAAAAVGLLLAAIPGIALTGAGHVPAFPRVLGGGFAAVLVALAGLMAREAWRQRFYRFDRFRLVVGTAAGEFPAFSDADEELVGRVAAAVKEALAARRG